MQVREQAAVRLLKALIVAAAVLPAVLFAYASLLNYRATVAAADERVLRSLDILHEHALKVFQSVELALSHTEALAAGLSDAGIADAQESLHRKLEQVVALAPEIASIWIFDRRGYPLVSSAIFPVPNFDASDRDFIRAQVERDRGLYVGEVLQSRIVGPAFFGISKRRPSANGRFEGVLEVSLRPDKLQEFYAQIGRRQPGSSYAALIRSDGSFLARYPAPPALPFKLDEDSSFRKAIAVSPAGALYDTRGRRDGRPRRMATHPLRDGIYLLAGIEQAVIRQEWLSAMASHLIFGLPATLLLVGIAVVALSRTRDFYAEAHRREVAEDALRQAQKMEAVGQLTGGVAHDFNNLLTVVIGNLEIARRTLDNWTQGAEVRIDRAVSAAARGAEKAAMLTQRLLAFSRRQPLDPKPLDPNRLVSGMTDLLKRTLGETVALETVTGGGAWRIETDPVQLESAILNLALNSRDAMPEGGKLTIEVNNAFLDEAYCALNADVAPGQYVMISVSDNGTGMLPEVASRAFEPFFTTKIAGQGTGLGLSQVYGFVKQSGGHVKIYSEPASGTSVRLYLPRLHAELTHDEAAQPVADAARGHETILVVEDDEDVRGYVVEMLHDLDYQVLDAGDATQALALAEDKTRRIDLLLTDVVLPGDNGRSLAEELAKRRPDICILFMTGYSRNAIVHQGRLDPGVNLIQKPLNRAALAARIRELLDARAAASQASRRSGA